MTTHEKLEQKIFNLVYQWGRVGIVADHTAPTYVAYIQKLIDTATREAYKEGYILGGIDILTKQETARTVQMAKDIEQDNGKRD